MRRLVCVLLSLLFFAVSARGAGALDDMLSGYAARRDATDWEVIVLGLNGKPVKNPLFGGSYFKRKEKEIAAQKGEYRNVTDYARIALAYKSHGKDPSDIAGYDFTAKIKDFPHMAAQGLNAYVWALTALYQEPGGVTAPLVESVLAYQAPGGGFSLAKPGGVTAPRADADMTAMAVTALSPYADDAAVRAAIDAALLFLSDAQQADGGYGADGERNAESVSQVIIALCSAGVTLDDARFVKNGHTALDALAGFFLPGGGVAHHLETGEPDAIAAYQAALALTAIKKAETGSWLYE